MRRHAFAANINLTSLEAVRPKWCRNKRAPGINGFSRFMMLRATTGNGGRSGCGSHRWRFLSPSRPVSLPLSRCHFNDSAIGHIYRKSHVSASVSRIRWMEVMVRQDECGASLSLTLLYTSTDRRSFPPLSLSLAFRLSFPISRAFFCKLRCVVLSVRLSATRSNFPIKPSGQSNTQESIYRAGRSYANWRYSHNVSHTSTECYQRSIFKPRFLRGPERILVNVMEKSVT